jgi:DNA repair exonuclease SbcCD ATPase subunit
VDLVCVCIRIAIAEYLSSRIGFKGFLILDGVFDRIDEKNRDAIGRLISEISLDQVLILSHFKVPIVGDREIML